MVPKGQELERGSGGWFWLRVPHEVVVKIPVGAAVSSEGLTRLEGCPFRMTDTRG